MPTGLGHPSTDSANCVAVGSSAICKPDALSKLQVPVKWPVSPLPHCAVQFSWNFGTGAPPVTTSGPSAEYAFPMRPVGQSDVPYTVTVTTGAHQAQFGVHVLWGTIELKLTTPRITEGGSPALWELTRSESTQRVTVRYNTNSLPAGYVAEATHEVTFEPGQVRRTIEVPVIDDDVYRSSNPSGTVFFAEAVHGYTLAQSTHFFEIEDDDEPVLHRFVQRAPRAVEGRTLALDIDRTGGAGLQTSVTVVAQGVSYNAPFAPGVTRNRVTIPIADDALYNGTRSLEVTCTPEGLPGMSDRIEVVVVDDESVPKFTPKLIEVTESDAAQFVSLVFNVAPQFGSGTWIDYRAQAGTASGDDFTLSPSGIFWPAGTATQTLQVLIAGDDVAENDETFTITLDGPDDVGDKITVRILDDDRPAFGLAFDKSEYELEETSAAVDVRRTDGGTGPMTATLRVHGRIPSFWTIDDIELTFAAGETQKRVPLPVDDGLFSGVRLATLELEWNGFAGASAELALTDDEPMPTLTLGDASVVEGAPGTTSRLEFPMTLSGPVGADMIFQITTHHGTAAATDYAPLANAMVAFPQGRTTASLTVFVLGDAENEAHETLTLEITSCCSQLAELVRGTATGTIRNDDSGDGGGGDPSAYTLEAPERVNESFPWLIGTVTRTNEARQVAYVAVRLTAGLGRQFTPATIRFAAHETKKEVRFYLDDHFYSGDGMALLELFAGGQLQAKREVLIRDNEPQPVIRIHDAPPLVTGDGIELQTRFAISVEPPLATTVQVKVSMAPGGRLYNAVDRVIDIPPFTSRVEVPVLVYPSGRTGEATLTMSLALWWAEPPNTPTLANTSASAKLIFTRTADATVQPYEPMFAAGTTRTLTLALYPAAVGSEPMQLSSSKTSVATVPETVAIAPGATSVAFDVAGHAKGDATVTITLPPYFQNKILTVPLSVYEPFAAVVQPQVLRLRTGETAQLDLSTIPGTGYVVHATATAVDASIVFVDQSVPVGLGGGVVDVYGANEGETEIIITFPEDGGTTLRVPVKVTKGTARRRSAGR
ncbi:MAG TPA: Calx-beta domain-containing protein [Thermoanaerobaculia bacterium]|nr:Calx-beta domain-containing protein [Thermoanaerobaculia bacterium]